jgi:YD repeat-containing protein
MTVGLNIRDIPLGYAPPRGPRMDFEVTYIQREIYQPQNLPYSNLGPKWTFDFRTYVEDDPTNADQDAKVYVRGGGQETYKKMIGGSGEKYVPHFETYARLVQESHAVPLYTRTLPDGSVEVFRQADGAVTAPRKIFLTERRDPQGNTMTFEYDASLRLTHVVDALGQDTELFYELAGDSYKITKVEDPFGRSATFDYNASGQLERITDVMGMESSFEYGPGDFIVAMETPYGRTTFAMGEYGLNNRNRWVEATDPLGGRERVEYLDRNQVFIDGVVPAGEVPNGFAGSSKRGLEWHCDRCTGGRARAATRPH